MPVSSVTLRVSLSLHGFKMLIPVRSCCWSRLRVTFFPRPVLRGSGDSWARFGGL